VAANDKGRYRTRFLQKESAYDPALFPLKEKSSTQMEIENEIERKESI